MIRRIYRYCQAIFTTALCIYLGVAQAQSESRRSGFDFMRSATQAMQRDDSQNPGMLWVRQGEQLWNQSAGSQNKSCASCHGTANTSMKGIAIRYPVFDERLKRPINLAQKINQCREHYQHTTPWLLDSQSLLALETYITFQARGLPIAPTRDIRLQPHLDRGKELYEQRLGQLNLSCAQCHDQNAGRQLGGNPIPQAHPTGYPIYRLEWQTVGSLQRRLRNCMTGVRAQPYALGAQELVELELYLAERARGMTLETPAVRP